MKTHQNNNKKKSCLSCANEYSLTNRDTKGVFFFLFIHVFERITLFRFKEFSKFDANFDDFKTQEKRRKSLK